MKIVFKASAFFFIAGIGVYESFAQTNTVYPTNAVGVITFANRLIETKFSTAEISKGLGTVRKATENDQLIDESIILLRPFAPALGIIEKIELYEDEDDKKLASADFSFVKSVPISYGSLRKKYGQPTKLKPPIVNCGSITPCKRPVFAGYSFKGTALASGKKVEISIILFMTPTADLPKHTDTSVLRVESIRFQRVPDWLNDN